MAKYSVDHCCGHEQTHELFGKHSERENRLAWLAKNKCTNCWKQDQAQAKSAESEKAAEKAKETGLPELKGSEKQVAWALSIRDKHLAASDKLQNGMYVSQHPQLAAHFVKWGKSLKSKGVPDEDIKRRGKRWMEKIHSVLHGKLASQPDSRFWIDARDRDTQDLLLSGIKKKAPHQS